MSDGARLLSKKQFADQDIIIEGYEHHRSRNIAYLRELKAACSSSETCETSNMIRFFRHILPHNAFGMMMEEYTIYQLMPRITPPNTKVCPIHAIDKGLRVEDGTYGADVQLCYPGGQYSRKAEIKTTTIDRVSNLQRRADDFYIWKCGLGFFILKVLTKEMIHGKISDNGEYTRTLMLTPNTIWHHGLIKCVVRLL